MFTRAAIPTFRAARTQFTRSVRGYASEAPKAEKKPSNIPFIFGGAGVAGLGVWAYLERSGKQPLAPAVPGLNGDAWTPLALSEVEQISDNTKVYKFNFEGDNAANKTAGITVAGVVLVRSPTGEGQVNDDKGKPVIRPYTPISSPDQRGSVDFLVKEYPTGKLTPWLSQLKKGDEILVKGPMTKFEYAPGQFDKALFVAGGSGVTPAYQLISHALENKADQTKWTFLFANVTEKDILMRKEWEQLAAANPDRLKVVYFLDNAPENWTGESGYVTADHIKKHFPREEGDKVRAFVCGPPGQYKAISGAKKGRDQGPVGGALKELGYKEEEVFKY